MTQQAALAHGTAKTDLRAAPPFPLIERLLGQRTRRLLLRALSMLVLLAVALAPQWSPRALFAQPRPEVDNGSLTAGAVSDLAFPQLQLPIWVTGADGLPVGDLLPADLLVTENGVAVAPDRISLVSSASDPISVVIAVDRSTNLPDWFDAIDAANALLAQLRSGDKAALIAYDSAVQVLTTLTPDIAAVRSALDNVAPPAEVLSQDPTVPNEYVDAAVRRAMQFFETEGPGRRAVVLLADGADDLVLGNLLSTADPAAIIAGNPTSVAGAAPNTLQRLTQLARVTSAPIHVYAYGPNATLPELALLAVGSGGRALAVSTAQDLAGNTQVLPSLLRQGYRLGYRSSQPADDAAHVLGIRLLDGEPLERSFVAGRSVVTVAITTPAAGSRQSGAFPVGVQVSASSEIVGMAFTLENGELITTTTRQVGGIIWDSSTTTPGARTLTVAAQDSAGNVGAAALPLTIVPPITVQASVPLTQVAVGEFITVTAAVDSFFPDVVVEVFLGNQQVGLAPSGSGVSSFLINTGTFEPGRYTVTVRASNSAGYSAVDAASVLGIVPAPRSTPPAVIAAGAWLRRWGPWLLLAAVLAAALIGLALWIQRELARRRLAAAQRAAQVIPHARLLITNTGNLRTPFRIRAEDVAGAYKYSFYVHGQQLLAPTAMHVATSVAPAVALLPVSNGASAPVAVVGAPAYVAAPAAVVPVAPVPAAAFAPPPGYAPPPQQPAPAAAPEKPGGAGAAGAASSVAGSVQQVAGFGRGLLGALGQVLPGQAGAAAQQASMKVAGTEARAASAQWKAADTVGDIGDVKGYLKPAGKAAPAPAPAQAPAPAAASVSPPPVAPPPVAPIVAAPPASTPQPAATAVTAYAPPIAPAAASPVYSPPVSASAPPYSAPVAAQPAPTAYSTPGYSPPAAATSLPVAAVAAGGATAPSTPPGYPAAASAQRPTAPPGYPAPSSAQRPAVPPGYPTGARPLPATPPGYAAPQAGDGGAAGSAPPRNPLLGRAPARPAGGAAESAPSQYILSDSPARPAPVAAPAPVTSGVPVVPVAATAPPVQVVTPAPVPPVAPAVAVVPVVPVVAAPPAGSAAVTSAPAAVAVAASTVPIASAVTSPAKPAVLVRNPLTSNLRPGAAVVAPVAENSDPRFSLRSESGSPVVSARSLAWVETPSVGPGETIGIDVHVASVTRGRVRGRRVEFSVFSMAAEDVGHLVKEWKVNVILGGD